MDDAASYIKNLFSKQGDEVVEEVIVEDVVVPDPSEFTLTIKNE